MLIYKATNKINGKSYIGQTVQTLNQRKSRHKYAVEHNEQKYSKFYAAIKKYGWDNFEWEILEENDTWSYEDLDNKEKYYIQFFDTLNNGYNLLPGGQDSITPEEMAILLGSEPFYAFNIKGEFLGEFINKSEFGRQYNIAVHHISNMIKNKELSANGIIVLDKKTYSLSKLQKRIKKCPKKLSFKAINKQTQEEFGPFNSQKECQEKLNLSSRSHISEVLKGSRDSAYGYYFKYI